MLLTEFDSVGNRDEGVRISGLSIDCQQQYEFFFPADPS